MDPHGMNRFLGASLIALSALVCACEPVFERKSGSLTVDGASFVPTRCQVRPSGGLELADAGGARLLLALPPETLNPWRDVSGVPMATYTAPGGTVAELGSCGRLTLTGEGYHGGGRRAASGTMSLRCGPSPLVSGEFTFSGCF